MESTSKPAKLGLFIAALILIAMLGFFAWQSVAPQPESGASDAGDTADGSGDTAKLGVTNGTTPGGVIGTEPPSASPPSEDPGTTPDDAQGGGNTDGGETAELAPPASAEDALREAAELERLRRQLEAETEEILADRELLRQAKSSPIGESRVDLSKVAPATPAGHHVNTAVAVSANPPLPTNTLPTIPPSLLQAAADSAGAGDNGQVGPAQNGNGQNSGTGQGAVTPSTRNAHLAIGYSPHRTIAPLSPYVLHKGTVIPGLLETGINSETPGVLSGTVRLDVFDTVTGTHRLVPAGSRLFGRYNADTNYGQKRLGVVWTHLTFPDGSAIRLEDQHATDSAGQAGFADQRKGNFLATLGGNLLFTVINATESAVEQRIEEEVLRATGGDPDAQQGGTTITIGGSGNSSALSNFNRQQSNLGPTLIIRPGYPFNVVVGRDLVLEPR